jgi:hypothetical protein
MTSYGHHIDKFSYLLNTQKKKIEMWKGTYLCKTKTISFSRLQRAYQSHGYITSNELLNLATIFVTFIQLTNIYFF